MDQGCKIKATAERSSCSTTEMSGFRDDDLEAALAKTDHLTSTFDATGMIGNRSTGSHRLYAMNRNDLVVFLGFRIRLHWYGTLLSALRRALAPA